MVIDVGGGATDISVFHIGFENKILEDITIVGDTHLGGEDFDQRVTDHFINIFKNRNNIDITNNKTAV